MNEASELDRRLATWRRYEPTVMRALPFLMLGVLDRRRVRRADERGTGPRGDRGRGRPRRGVAYLVPAGATGQQPDGSPVCVRARRPRGGARRAVALVRVLLLHRVPQRARPCSPGRPATRWSSSRRRRRRPRRSAAVWNIQGAGIVVYLVVFGINAGLFLVFGQYGDLIERQNDQRKETIDELARPTSAWSGDGRERRPARPARRPGPRRGGERGAAAAGPGDPRHDRAGPGRDRRTARGGRPGSSRRAGRGTSVWPVRWPARASARPAARSRRCSPGRWTGARLPEALAGYGQAVGRAARVTGAGGDGRRAGTAGPRPR